MKRILKRIIIINFLIAVLDIGLLHTGAAQVSNSKIIDERDSEDSVEYLVESEFSLDGRWYTNKCWVSSKSYSIQKIHYDILYPKHNCADGDLLKREFYICLPTILILIIYIARNMTNGEANILSSLLSLFDFGGD